MLGLDFGQEEELSSIPNVHTGAGSQPAAYVEYIGGAFRENRKPEREADHNLQAPTLRICVLYFHSPFHAECVVIN